MVIGEVSIGAWSVERVLLGALLCGRSLPRANIEIVSGKSSLIAVSMQFGRAFGEAGISYCRNKK